MSEKPELIEVTKEEIASLMVHSERMKNQLEGYMSKVSELFNLAADILITYGTDNADDMVKAIQDAKVSCSEQFKLMDTACDDTIKEITPNIVVVDEKA